MARLQDIPHVLRTVGLREFCRRISQEMREDSLFVWACALAYSWLFAIFPFLIFLLTLAPYLPMHLKNYAGDMIHFGIRALPGPAQSAVWENVQRILLEGERRAVLSVGLVLTLWAASGGMYMTMIALDRCYDLPRSRAFFKMRLWAIGMTVVLATLILAVLMLLPIGTFATHWVVDHYPGRISQGMIWAWNGARYSLAMMLMVLILAILYYFGPSIKQKFHAFTPGAVFCIVVWISLSLLFRLYVNKFGRYDKTYGSLGGCAILLLFFYLDALVLLVGAEINSEIDFACGVPRGSIDFRPCRPLFSDADETSDAESNTGEVAIPSRNGTDRRRLN